MSTTVLSINPCVANLGTHDPSAVLMCNGEVIFAVEEERYTREKHAVGKFPRQAIESTLTDGRINRSDIEMVVIPWSPHRFIRMVPELYERIWTREGSVVDKAKRTAWRTRQSIKPAFFGKRMVEAELRDIGLSVTNICFRKHHTCHAASAFFPSGYDEAVVLTMDGRGETDGTVVWEADESGLERMRTYPYTNSLGFFYGAVTKFLGYHANNGEGKVMGLAPYGQKNENIEEQLRNHIETGVNYDLTAISAGGFEPGTQQLEEIFGRTRNTTTDSFSQWEKDLAFTAQSILEEIVVNIVESHVLKTGISDVCLAGGVALNCKVNKEVMELDCVDNLFIQPVSHDAGSALGGAMLSYAPEEVAEMESVYWGPSYDTNEIKQTASANKLAATQPDDLAHYVASKIADGRLVGWFQGRLEMGPRALGHRSILADPRTIESRDRVNKYVKHREEWRPFAPSILAEALDSYLQNPEPSPYMIQTFDTKPEKRDEIIAVVHPEDMTTRPQSVTKEANPMYHQLISEFYDITGVPVLLNTSFNDHGEPIVTNPDEAIRDFFGMGLDLLVMEDVVITKPD